MTASKKKRGKKETTQAETQSRDPKQTRQKDEFDPLHQVAFWGLALLLFFPPYFRGLFFAPEQENALIFATLVFWLTFLWRWLKRDYKFLRGPLDWLALALPLVYIISSFTAVNKGLAIDEVVKNILYFMTYWSVSRLVRNQEDVHRLLHVIYISAIGVALAGLATATEIIHIKDGFNTWNGFISSTLQYHNALAVYLAVVFFIGLYLWHCSNDHRRSIVTENGNTRGTARTELIWSNAAGLLYTCGNFLLLAVLLGSKSRGGLLVFVLVFIFYVVVIGSERRLSVSLILGSLGAIAYVVISKFITLVLDKQYDSAWLWVIGGLILAIISQLAYTLLERHVFNRWIKEGQNSKFTLAFALLAVIAIVAGGIWLTGKTEVFEKVTSAEYLKTAFHRFHYMESAAEMIKERPVLGWGGGGWKEAYEAYLSYRYTTREVHSYYFQVGVETGVLGVVCVLGIWLSFLYSAYRLLRGSKNKSQRQLVYLLVAAFLMIAGHAFIDFDLSLSAITIVLWSVFGSASALLRLNHVEERQRIKQSTGNYAPVVATTVVSLIIMVACSCLLHANNLYNQGMSYLRANNVTNGVKSLEKAVAYNPYNANYRVILSHVYNGLGKKDDALAEAQAAVNMSPYSFAACNNLVKTAIANDNHELAAREIENTLTLAPNNIEVYEEYAQNYVNMGIKELTANKQDAAKEYLNKAIAVAELINERSASLQERDLAMWQGPRLAVNDKIQLSMGQAHYFLGNFTEAQKYLQQASKSGNKIIKGQALVWQAVLHEHNGQAVKSQKFINQAETLTPEFVQLYQGFKEIPVLSK